MWVSEVKPKVKRERGNFVHRKTFEAFDEARLWATNLAEAIIIGGFWSEEELVMEHREVK